MLRKTIALGVGLAILVTMSTCYGAIATWTFPNNTDTSPSLAGGGNQSGSAQITSPSSSLVAGNGSFALQIPTSGQFTIQINGTSLSGFQVTYDGIVSSGTAGPFWSWSTDNTTYTALATQPGAMTTTWGSFTADFSGISQLNNSSTVYFRDNQVNGATFDNISVVPEPINAALVLFGLCIGSVGIGRRLCLSVRS